MTSTTPETRPAVAAFLAEVRTRLGDLSPEQRDDLLEGLEADLSEQLAEGDASLLSDPTAYAAELRAAAGLPPASRVSRWTRRSDADLDAGLDRLKEQWLELVGRSGLGREAWTVVVALRPAWWALRAWSLVTLLDQATGPWESVTFVPHLGVPLLGPAVLVGAVVLSVLVGQGRLWPGTPPRASLARVTLIAVNVVAVLAPLYATGGPASPGGFTAGVDTGYANGYLAARAEHPTYGLRVGGRMVSNVFAYDLDGVPVEGVQLFDQDGEPLALQPRQAQAGDGATRTVGCPWFNGASPLFNVVPLQERTQRELGCRTPESRRTGQVGEIVAPAPPLAQVPPVTRAP